MTLLAIENIFARKLAILFLAAAFFTACSGKFDIPTDFPTPPPNPPAAPAPKLVLKADAELEKLIAKIAEETTGRVGVAAVLLETGEAAFFNADQHYPMQSVYKLPIAMAVMEQVRLDKLDLDEQIGVTKEDMVRAGMRSPLRDAKPNGGEFPIRELIRLALVESDGTASDVLMRVAGGAGEIQAYLTQIGIRDMKVVNTEKEIGKDWQTQYENWATPVASVELLRWISYVSRWKPATNTNAGEIHKALEPDYDLLVDWMDKSQPGAKRLRGLLPKGNSVAHKTGTGGSSNGLVSATNDIGIFRAGQYETVVIAVYVSDSPADERTREAVIAKIAKAVFDRWRSID